MEASEAVVDPLLYPELSLQCPGMGCAHRRFPRPDAPFYPDPYPDHLLHDHPERMCGDLLYPVSAKTGARGDQDLVSIGSSIRSFIGSPIRFSLSFAAGRRSRYDQHMDRIEAI